MTNKAEKLIDAWISAQNDKAELERCRVLCSERLMPLLAESRNNILMATAIGCTAAAAIHSGKEMGHLPAEFANALAAVIYQTIRSTPPPVPGTDTKQ